MDILKENPHHNTGKPLSVRLRPENLDEFVGQKHILGENCILTRAIKSDRLTSLIFYGPPGCGKTSLAWCISRVTKSHFVWLNATTSNVEELRKQINAAKKRKQASSEKTILFIDEIHRFNKSQQDILMPDVEEANIILIGATVNNPFFSIVAPLISRSLVLELKALGEEDIYKVLTMALKDKRGLGEIKIKAQKKALIFISKVCDGDARRALNALEIGVLTSSPASDGYIQFDINVAEESIQKKVVLYDRDGDAHYDTASAFIKAMRGSDPDSALYWMAKMLYAGEDPRFIARRICILAAEDVGNADPLALVLANAALQISEFIGMPEARIPLAQAVIYVSCAPKSNAAYLAIDKANQEVEKERLQEVPLYLKDASYAGAAKLGRGKDYKYPHSFKGHYIKQDYTPRQVRFYEPTENGYEAKMKQRLEKLRTKKQSINGSPA